MTHRAPMMIDLRDGLTPACLKRKQLVPEALVAGETVRETDSADCYAKKRTEKKQKQNKRTNKQNKDN